MFGIQVNVLTGEVKEVPLTEKEIEEAQARTLIEKEEQLKAAQDTETETLIQAKIRTLAITALTAEGKFTEEDKLT